MSRRRIRTTDFGIIILHWALAGLLLISVTTGLRIAIGSPYDMTWLQAIDFLLPQANVWTWHIPAGSLLFALAVSYTIYLVRSGLFRRVQPDLSRIAGITAGRLRARLAAINIILYWLFVVTIVVELVTGILLYLGHAGLIADIHWFGTWIIVAYVPAHLLVHMALGGARQLLRIFNPGPLTPAPAPAPPDPFEIIAENARRARRHAAPVEAERQRPHRPDPAPAEMTPPSPATQPRLAQRGKVLHAHPLAVAAAGGMGALVMLMSLDQVSRDTLVIEEIVRGQTPPTIDGDVSDPIWRDAQAVTVRTQQGANLRGEGGTNVQIRGVHDGTYVYLSFVWDDPTRSLKHLPLVKTRAGWLLLHDKFDLEDANAYFEDKLSVLLVPGSMLIPGDNTFHAGNTPLKGMPSSYSGRGFHYTTDGSYVDVWQWHATSGGPLGWMDDAHFGPPTQPTEAEIDGSQAYKGGFAQDPGTAPTRLNFAQRGRDGYDTAVTPLRLPRRLAETQESLGTVDLNPDHGESAGARWWMSEAQSVPYSKAADDVIPIGSIIPGVIASGAPPKGDRADIRCAARWAAGRWALEVVRRLDTRSRFDVPIKTDTYMRVAVFDHSQSRHTRHIRPIRLQVNTCVNDARCLSTTRLSQQSGARSF